VSFSPFSPLYFLFHGRALEEQRREKIKDRLLNLEKFKTMKPKGADVTKPAADLQQASEREAAAKRKPTVEVERDELDARKRRKLEVSLYFLPLLSTANILESHYKLN
jgi:hypothetical protein